MKTAVILTVDTRYGGYGSVEAVLLGESNGRTALETFAKDRGVAANIAHVINDHWSLSIPYKGADGNMYQNDYTAVIIKAKSTASEFGIFSTGGKTMVGRKPEDWPV